MAMSFEKCELLCYIQNKYSSATKSSNVSAVSGFYSNDEVSDAKLLLYDIIDKLRDSGRVPPEMTNRMINRKHGDQKRRLDTEDLLSLFADIDAHKIPIPVFVAANLQRIPPFAPDATDFCSLAFNVNQMQSQMASLEKQVGLLLRRVQGVPVDSVVIKGAVSSDAGATSDEQNTGYDNAAVPTWASTAAQDTDKWEVVNQKQSSAGCKPKSSFKVKKAVDE